MKKFVRYLILAAVIAAVLFGVLLTYEIVRAVLVQMVTGGGVGR
jgi:hypothetical protein